MKRYGKVHVDEEMVLASMYRAEDEAFTALSDDMQKLGDVINTKLFGCRTCCKRQPARGRGQCAICITGCKEEVRVTSRRIRRNALRELKRRLRWGKGAGKVTEWKTDSKGRLVPIHRRARSFSEALRTMDVAKVAADKRVGESEMALLYATQGWRP